MSNSHIKNNNSFDDVLSNTIETVDKANNQGMHIESLGNISLHLNGDTLPPASELTKQSQWQRFEEKNPLKKIASEYFLVTGEDLKDLSSKQDTAIGVVEINKEGTAFRRIWGFANGETEPTSEFLTHLRSQNTHTPGAVYRGHPKFTSFMMDSGEIKNRSDATKIVWQNAEEEGVKKLPGGLGYLGYVNQAEEIANRTAIALLNGVDAVLWDKKGILVKDDNLDFAYNKALTVERAMKASFQAISETGEVKWLSMQDLVFLVQEHLHTLAKNPMDTEVWQLLQAREISKLSTNRLEVSQNNTDELQSLSTPKLNLFSEEQSFTENKPIFASAL